MVPSFAAGLLDVGLLVNTGVVDQHVQLSEPADDRPHGEVPVLFAGHIEPHE
jgi:hypothetical protein